MTAELRLAGKAVGFVDLRLTLVGTGSGSHGGGAGATLATQWPLTGGVVEVRLISAFGLVPNKRGTANALVTLSVGKDKRKSKVKKATLDPAWDEVFEFARIEPQVRFAVPVFGKKGKRRN